MSASASKKKRKELEEQGLSAKDVAVKKASEKRNKTLRTVLIWGLAVVVCIAAIFAVIKLVNRPTYDTSAPAFKVGEESVSVPVYNIFYNNTVYNLMSDTSNYLYLLVKTDVPLSEQSYGDGTFEDYFKEQVNTSLQNILSMNAKAKAAGYKLTDEDKDQIEANLDAVKSDAKNYGWPDVDDYLDARYGDYCDLDAYEDYLEMVVLASSYYNHLRDEYKPGAEELQAEYDADPSVYDLVDVTYAAVSAESTVVEVEPEEGAEGEGSEEGDGTTTEPTNATTTVYTDEAKAEAREKAEGYLTEMPEDAVTATYSKTNASYYLNTEIIDWLFDAERKDGDAKVFARNEDETSFYAVRFNSKETNDYPLIDANVFAIEKDAADAEIAEGEMTAEEKKAELLAAVKEGMTDEELSAAVTPLGYTVSTTGIERTSSAKEVAEFLYDSARKAGDLMTDYEDDNYYYVIRYVSVRDETYRNEQVWETLFNRYYEELTKETEYQTDEELMKHAKTDLTFYSNTSEG